MHPRPNGSLVSETMKNFQNILVATDTRSDDHPVVDEAADIAEHNQASLKIVDVMPDLSWSARLLLQDYQHIFDMLTDEKQQKLDALAAKVRDRGVAVETKVLHGKSSVAIIREVLNSDHDLVIRVHKGAESRGAGFFGNTAIRLLRKCPAAVWLVPPQRIRFKHVLGCLDTSTADESDEDLNEQVLDLTQTVSKYHGGSYSLLHAWTVWNALFLQRRMHPDDFAQLVKKNHDQTERQFMDFLKRHGAGIAAERVHLIEGEPADVIPEFARSNNVDLVVMGTVARSGVAGVVMGNTAEQILGRLECSVLALKPAGFVSPIKAGV